MQQGSMQAQGEASELALEKQLKTNFPFDQVVEKKRAGRCRLHSKREISAWQASWLHCF